MTRSYIYKTALVVYWMAWLCSDHYRPWESFHSEMLAFAGLFGFLAAVLIQRQLPVLIPQVGQWVGVTALLPWLQYMAGISLFAGDALLSSLYLCGLAAAIVVGYAFSPANVDFRAPDLLGLMHCLWLAAMVSAVIGLAQWLNLNGALGMYVVQTALGDRAMGNLSQPNHLSTFLLMGMAAFAYVYEQRVIERLAFVLGTAFMTAVLVLTQSRSGMLSVLLVAIFLIWKNRTVTLRLSSAMVVGWAICFFLGVLLLPYLSDALLLGQVRGVTSAAAVEQRWRMWQQVAYAIVQAPWVGYGWNQTPTAHAAGAIAFPADFTYTNAHNIVMDLVAWNGLPIGLLLSASMAYWMLTRILRASRPVAVFAMTGLLPLAVHSMLEFPFAYAYFLITAGLLVGVVEATTTPTKTRMLSVRWAWALLTSLLMVCGYLTNEYFQIEEDFRVVRFENLRVGKTPAMYEIPPIWMLSHMGTMLKVARQEVQPNMTKMALEDLRKVSLRFPYGAMHLRYVLALALNGDPQEARHQMAIIHGMFGDFYYNACKQELYKLQQEKYPQLAGFTVP